MTGRIRHDEQNLSLRVEAMRRESEGVLSVELVDPSGALLPAWAPGSHIDLTIGQTTRQYSLCSDPADRRHWRIGVLREAAGRGGSAAVHDKLRVGDVVTVVGPRNNFSLPDAEEYLFVAGGIGITPILPMIREVAAAGSPWHLLYGGRTRSSMAFLGELEPYGDHVELCPADEFGQLDLAKALDAVPERSGAVTAVCCCGPEPLLRAIESLCEDWSVGSLYLERFTAKEVEAPAGGDQEFELVLAQQNESISVAPGQTILEAMEAQGFQHVSSCREGICGTCETTVLEGKPDHRDSLLSPEEQETNETMMICVGRSLSPRLVLDL